MVQERNILFVFNKLRGISAGVKFSELDYPYCSQALAAEIGAVRSRNGMATVKARLVVQRDSGFLRHRVQGESLQRLAASLGGRRECSFLSRSVALHEDHKVSGHLARSIALCQIKQAIVGG
jgi:hypothetical protein